MKVKDLDPRQTPVLTINEGTDREHVVFGAWPKQLEALQCEATHLLCLGTRGTGKSKWLRSEAIIRCLLYPGFKALILRRTMPELRESHLNDIPIELMALGGEDEGFVYLSTIHRAKFPNGSSITFAHCETETDVLNFLSSQYGFIGFDELSTFSLDQFLKISASARSTADSGYRAVIRAGSNPIGPGADWMYAWFVDHDVDPTEFPYFDPANFAMIFSTLEDNPSLDAKTYRAQLGNLPEHMRKGWLEGERVIEGMYFMDFHKTLNDKPWHVIDELPRVKGHSFLDMDWIRIYRAVDWGYFPDPAVCLWIAMMPNGRSVVFKEKHWSRTRAPDVAQDIVNLSQGMQVVETFCDPSMEIEEGHELSIGDQFELNGVPITASKNDRAMYGYAIHDHLNAIIDERPKLQIYRPACPELVRTIPMMRMDKTDPAKIAKGGKDHWVVSLAYYCMGQAVASEEPETAYVPAWMLPKRKHPLYRNS